MSFPERANPDNYTIGGVRLMFNELIDGSTTPKRYRGMVDLGCVEEAPIGQETTFQEHFCASSGVRVKDKKVVKEVSATITATLIEIDPENLRLFFLAGAITTVAAGTKVVTDEVVRLEGFDKRILKDAVLPLTGSPVVTDLTGVTTYVLNTDYELVDYLGYKAIRRKAGGSITDGQYVLVDYTGTLRASKDFKPLTNIQKEGQLHFFGVSDTGNEINYFIDRASIAPSGDFNWNSDDWTTFQLEIEILDNTSVDSATPFGTVHHYGTGQNI